MKPHNIRAVLVMLAIITTVLLTMLFFVGIIETVPHLTGPQAVVIISALVVLPLLPTAILASCLFVVSRLHGYIMKWEDREDALQQRKADREHYYQHHRDMRELEREEYRHLLRPRRYRIKHCARHLRHLKRRPKDD